MKFRKHLTTATACGLLSGALSVTALEAAYAQSGPGNAVPRVFQASGPDAASIQGTVDAFRAALGGPNNGNNPGPLASGRREINWDGGGGVDATTEPVTPFNVFLNTRGGQFTTPGAGLTQAPASGGPQGGLAALFDNPTYATTFTAFSPLRLFSSVGSKFTDAYFFIPGTAGAEPAVVSGFGVVFTDVDQPDGRRGFESEASTRVEYFDADGKRVFRGSVASSPGDGSQSFLGVVFDDARIGSVRIRSGNRVLGPDDGGKVDVVVMDDFLYGEPRPIR
jgi:hypothetical protein